MYVGNRRNKLLLLAEQHFIRTCTVQATGKKRKKVTATKRKDTTPKTRAKTTVAEERVELPKATYPFYLPKENPTLPSEPITIPHSRVDIDEGRYYNLEGGSETYVFPGVTHVISATRPDSFSFAMKNWEKNMIKEHGEEGFQKMKVMIRRQGHDFHEVSFKIVTF